MSKLVKMVLIFTYAILFIQYLKLSFTNPVIEEVDIEYVFRKPGTHKRLLRHLRKNIYNETVVLEKYNKPIRFSTDYKYILKWTDSFIHSSSILYRNGQFVFTVNNCTYTNCYLTSDRTLLMDARNFDAVLFDVESMWDNYPEQRDPRQKYIFTASESAESYPVCYPDYDNYFNLTWTYRLASDIRRTYLSIFDKNGTDVGPRINMSWIDPMLPTPEKIKKKFIAKSKAAAWFVSNCKAKSGRYNLTKQLEKALEKYNLKVDIFGWCGRMSCPKDRFEDCLLLLETDYYFYLAFENSLCEDYVTEKLLYPLRHYTVPIVFGGADYSRFLPPNSYINAGIHNVTEVAALMAKAIENPEVYQDYFRWHNHYEYKESLWQADVCNLCRILNEDQNRHSVVRNFRTWWNPNHKATCGPEIHAVDNQHDIDQDESDLLKEDELPKGVNFIKVVF